MIRQIISLPFWGWRCSVFYAATSGDAESILSALEAIGCHGSSLERAERNLYAGVQNTGLTYTNQELHRSVMVIGKTSTPAQFWNTLDHEKGHLAEHIAEALNIERRGEEFEYLKGEIAQEAYPVAVQFLCKKCRR